MLGYLFAEECNPTQLISYVGLLEVENLPPISSIVFRILEHP